MNVPTATKKSRQPFVYRLENMWLQGTAAAKLQLHTKYSLRVLRTVE